MLNLLRTQHLFALNLNMLVKSGTCTQSNVFKKLNKSKKFIFQDYRRDTDTSHLNSRLNQDFLTTRWLIQQAAMSYKIHYYLVDIGPPSYIQHANHISNRTDHFFKYFSRAPHILMHMNILFFFTV